MRQIRQEQIPILEPCGKHQFSKLLEKISMMLDEHPTIAKSAFSDLTNKGKHLDLGRRSLSADQVVRAAILGRLLGCSYRDLDFNLEDSSAGRRFVRLGLGWKPKKSVLQKDIKRLKPLTWELINSVILDYAKDIKFEDGKKVRTDTTTVEANIHHPTDSQLLSDCIRVVTRLLCQSLEQLPGLELEFKVHLNRAQRRAMEIHNPSQKKNAKRKRKKAYKDLLKITKWTYDYGRNAIPVLRSFKGIRLFDDVIALDFAQRLEALLPLVERVIDQTHRRVLQGESVPADEKIVSIFEEHIDVIRRDNRDTSFGHKLCLSTGKTCMITDAYIEDGNPADVTLVKRTIQRHIEQFGYPPKQMSFDGGFASRDNLEVAKTAGVKDAVFHKKRGITTEEMTSSPSTFKKMKGFRAGIEGVISALKRDFGLKKCKWRGKEGFHSYVWCGVVAYNLVAIGKHLLHC